MEKTLNAIAAGLVLLCFVISLGRIALRETPGGEAAPVEIRLAHWQLEGGVRESFDALAAEYQRLHPHVRIIQIPIPERIYKNWLLTQLVGGTAPDIIQVGIGISDERLARYFVPLTPYVSQPNPYNAGTKLENIPLRETFFDGMLGGYNINLLEYYGVPLSAYTIRVFINTDLLQEITGSTEMPANYREFHELCRKVHDYSQSRGRTILPIAGSRYNAPILMDRLFASQTQRLVLQLAAPGQFIPPHYRISSDLAEGDWNLQSPAVASGLRLIREVSGHMQPGFLQLGRDDATFQFMQGKALMIISGSWDAASVRRQAHFNFRAFSIPLPAPDDPDYGGYVLGPVSEADTNAGLSLGITQNSPQREIALDFLLFCASQTANQLFAEKSGWIPSVVGIPPNALNRDFMINVDGYISGFNLKVGGFPDVTRVVDNALHRLVSPTGGVDAFVNEIQPSYLAAQLSDLDRSLASRMRGLQRLDLQVAAAAELHRLSQGEADSANRLDALVAAAAQQQRSHAAIQRAAERIRQTLQTESR